ncbi:MAG: hypothetical protein HQL03_03955 [Nitrospirae bacterium]|nr:hypothetical protein [Nitrospirota bacterium]MBF0590955.1 hypothetical protein [Nitrospirota bacterium]
MGKEEMPPGQDLPQKAKMILHKSNKNVIVDSCIWFALFNKSDGNHKKALTIIKNIDNQNILCPWPILLETLNTRFVKDKINLSNFNSRLKHFTLIDDQHYRKQALEATLYNAIAGKRYISLVDMVIRYILSDKKTHAINYLATFNIEDFIDVCKERKITILQE